MDSAGCSNEKVSEGLDQPNETREHMSNDVANPEDSANATGHGAITPLAVLAAAKGGRAKGSKQERISLQSLKAFRCSLCRKITVLDSPGEDANDISTHSDSEVVGRSSGEFPYSHWCVDKVGTGAGSLAVSINSDGLNGAGEVHTLQEQVRELVVRLRHADDGKDAAVADCAGISRELDEAQQQQLRTHQQLTSERARCERLTEEMSQEKQQLAAAKLDLQQLKAAFSTITDNLQRAVVEVDPARSKRTADTPPPVLVQHDRKANFSREECFAALGLFTSINIGACMLNLAEYCLRDVNIVSQFKSQNCNWMMLLLVLELCLLYWLNRVLATLVEHRTFVRIGKWLLWFLAALKEWNTKVSAAVNERIMTAELDLTQSQ
ncbi:hypothetical protein LTR97_006504 [Elasticomyces elasticus]|uniref:Uncharacterized protein n=1 Tax=Elasticomyces elasticus TaxID=574655 RepID=A0AAN8A0U7_9PEZI|nr:hypothetical protein LTR97_006504 [Elasticomyces elasticus]